MIYIGAQTNGLGTIPIYIEASNGTIQYANIDGIRRRNYQIASISDIALLAALESYKERDIGFDIAKYDRIINYEIATVFVYGSASISVIHESCTFVVNEPAYEEGQLVYNYY